MNSRSAADRQGLLIIICGLPGAGKTTLAKKLETELSAVRLCPDEWMEDLGIDFRNEDARARIERLQWKLGKQVLSAGGTVIVEWGTWGRSERDALRDDARQMGARAELIYLPEPSEELYRRVALRGRENPPLSHEEVQGWFEIFEVPDEAEQALYDGSAVGRRSE